MEVKFIIPIKNYLAKFLRPENDEITSLHVHAVREMFSIFPPYEIKKRKVINYYFNKTLCRRIRPNEIPQALVNDYSKLEYVYLRFTLPIAKNRYPVSNYRSIEREHLIKLINKSLENYFWKYFYKYIERRGAGTIEEAIGDFYKDTKINETELAKSYLKRKIYTIKSNRSD